jgi:hypothetical protein
MIRYLKHREIDKNRWDDCIVSSDNRLIYALSWYLDIVSPGWDALIMDDYKAVMPLTWKKKWGLKYLVQPLFCQQLGVFSTQGSCLNTSDFIHAIPFKFLRVRIQLNCSNYIDKGRFRILPKVNFELSLNTTYTDLFNKYSTSHKKNIRTGKNRPLSLNYSTDLPMFWNFFMQNHQTKFKLNRSAYEVLRRLLTEVSLRAEYKIGIAQAANMEPAAAILLMKKFDRWVLLLSPSNLSGSRNRAIYLLIDHFIKEHAEKPEILDFEGSNIKGIADFYRGFGSEEMNYWFLGYSRLPLIR